MRHERIERHTIGAFCRDWPFRHEIEGPCVAIIGHGRSPEGQCWGAKIDACGTVIRMWDCDWQQPEGDYGIKYDLGLYEVHPAMARTFSKNVRWNPDKGWIASVLGLPARGSSEPPNTEMVDQKPWNNLGMRLGGIGKTGRLQFTRGTIAACWAIERLGDGGEVILVGFDNIRIGRALPLNEAFCEVYQKNPGTFSFHGYHGGETKHGNHDYAIERPVMETLAKEHGVSLAFSQDVW